MRITEVGTAEVGSPPYLTEAHLHARLYGCNRSLGVLGKIEIHCRRSERNDDGCDHVTRQVSHAHQAAIRSGVASCLLDTKNILFVC